MRQPPNFDGLEKAIMVSSIAMLVGLVSLVVLYIIKLRKQGRTAAIPRFLRWLLVQVLWGINFFGFFRVGVSGLAWRESWLGGGGCNRLVRSCCPVISFGIPVRPSTLG
jgi:hypothetical protein